MVRRIIALVGVAGMIAAAQASVLDDMRTAVSARAAALDHLHVQVEYTGFITRDRDNPLDESGWEPIPVPMRVAGDAVDQPEQTLPLVGMGAAGAAGIATLAAVLAFVRMRHHRN